LNTEFFYIAKLIWCLLFGMIAYLVKLHDILTQCFVIMISYNLWFFLSIHSCHVISLFSYNHLSDWADTI